ncbi:hypothetical protein EPUL_004396 [Erysiphe pulchra]|uniref:Uncharacterized protein n=1 Tax=Erysiphe pulchra TaxID=225359 RepID=A0A2S4PMI7_9PEZI|nr:hypothetical protein EPUL_004396 [Erysiphe pulchra]
MYPLGQVEDIYEISDNENNNIVARENQPNFIEVVGEEAVVDDEPVITRKNATLMSAREVLPENVDNIINNLFENNVDQENIDPFESAFCNLDPELNGNDNRPVFVGGIRGQADEDDTNVAREENLAVERRASTRMPYWNMPLPTRRSAPATYYSRYNPNMRTHSLGNRTSICPSCKALHWVQERVHSSSIVNPRFQTCCKEGQVVLDAIPGPPEVLRWLWTSEQREAKEFRCHSRNYNLFAFTSLNYTEDKRLEERGIREGIRSFSIHGQIYHQTGGALNEGAVPSYAQLYFIEPNEANEMRAAASNLNTRLVNEISEVIEQTNPFVSHYRAAHDMLNSTNVEEAQRIILNPQIRLILERGTDRRRFNLPTAEEVAVVIPDVVESDNRDIVLFARNEDGSLSHQFQYINRSHPAYLPFHYVLFYPYGNPGYRWSIPLGASDQRIRANDNHSEESPDENSTGKVSARMYYRYHLFSRLNTITGTENFNTLIYGEMLFQQLCCDMYACVDDAILHWHRQNQDTFRADMYCGAIDALREILSQLQHSQSPNSRPDLIAITFKLKLDGLLNDVKEKNVFGKCIGDSLSIEYQKRGLPHAHLISHLHRDDIPRTVEQIDELVCAQMPINDPELAAFVKTHLTHGPCGPDFPNAPCMRDGKCSKGFPKRWCERTVLAENSYPEYARPNNGVTWGSDRFTFDNRWVVPFNPYLTKKYSAHINVEVAHGIQAIKYLAKYVYKGSDRASLALQGEYDEIALTLQGRYIGPVQAVWRLMGYSTHEERPAVIQLPYHLEGRHRVAFTETMTREQVAVAIQSQSSIFIDWMKYNNANPDGRDLVYCDFPLYYTYNKKRGWQKRKKGQSIGRLPVATPRQGEHFYLRTQLSVKRGARSYRDLYTVNDINYELPSAACRAMGLTFDDSEWVSLFNDVKDTSSASSLRRKFAAAIHDAVVHDPQALWDRFKIPFTDDCVWRMSRLGESLNSPPSDWSDDRLRFDFGLWLLETNLKDLGMNWAAARMSGYRADEYIDTFHSTLQSVNNASEAFNTDNAGANGSVYTINPGLAAAIFILRTQHIDWLATWRETKVYDSENQFTSLQSMMSSLRTTAGNRAQPINMIFAATESSDRDLSPEAFCTRCMCSYKNKDCFKQHPELAPKRKKTEKHRKVKGNGSKVTINSDSDSEDSILVASARANEISTIYDTGASHHFVSQKNFFCDLKSCSKPFKFDQAVGAASLHQRDNAQLKLGNTTFHLHDALYSPNSSCNIISAGRLERLSNIVADFNKSLLIQMRNEQCPKLVAYLTRKNDVYYINPLNTKQTSHSSTRAAPSIARIPRVNAQR